MPRSVNDVPLQSKTQRAAILRLLIDAHGAWVPLPEILALGVAQYNARIFELRRLHFNIENRTEQVDGVRHSWFRLASSLSPEPVNPKPLKSWEQVCAERDEKMRQPEPSFELTPP